MSQITADDLARLLENWAQAKAEIAASEKKIMRYKRLAQKAMDARGQDQISSSEWTLNRRSQSRSTLVKKDVPQEVWDMYSRATSFSAYYLSQKGAT